MKKIILLGLIIISILSCKAQIIPVEEQINYMHNEIEIPEGAYIKDVNNVLDRFVGTWSGTYDNRILKVQIIKVKNNFLNISKDELKMRYRITDLKGNLITDTTLIKDDEDVHVNRGRYLAESGSYVLNYIGFNSKCGQNGDVFIHVRENNLSQLILFLHPDGETFDCDDPKGYVDQVLPTEQITLTKQ